MRGFRKVRIERIPSFALFFIRTNVPTKLHEILGFFFLPKNERTTQSSKPESKEEEESMSGRMAASNFAKDNIKVGRGVGLRIGSRKYHLLNKASSSSRIQAAVKTPLHRRIAGEGRPETKARNVR